MEDRPRPSSATEGFFQGYPIVAPAYTSLADNKEIRGIETGCDDAVLINILRLYLPDPIPSALDKSLHHFARKCLDPETLRLMVDCETHQPTLHALNTFGEVNNIDALRTSEGWRGLKDIQTRAGIVGHGYRSLLASTFGDSGYADQPTYNLRVFQFALAHLWSPSCASVSCPAAMSDGAAILLSRHISRPAPANPVQDHEVLKQVLQDAYRRLTSLDPKVAWTSGQWMTERPGGSDVSMSETLARLARSDELHGDKQSFGGCDVDSIDMPLGPFIIDGFKWFSSATDADMVVLLARTPRGLSTFYAPMKRIKLGPDGRRIAVMNGVRISRLKNKLGTKGLPTAELEIKGMRAWLLGEEGKGVKEISAILNATRLWTASGSVGAWGRGLAVSRAYAQVRRIKDGRLLAENRQHLKWMAEETMKYRAYAHLGFLGVALLGISESGQAARKGTSAERWLPGDKQQAELLLRILTPVMKARCSLASTLGLRECMESLGGVGYCENQENGGTLNVAKLFRDSNVNPIWEGTSNIMAEDFIRVAKGRTGPQAMSALGDLIERMLTVAGTRLAVEARVVQQSWLSMRSWLTTADLEIVLYEGRRAMQWLQEVVCASLLMVDAMSTNATVETVIAERFVASRFKQDTIVSPTTRDISVESDHDQEIFLSAHKDSLRSIKSSKL